MLSNTRLVTLTLLVIFFLSGCRSKVKFVEPDPIEADSAIGVLNNEFIQSQPQNFNVPAGAPTLWQSFEAFFKSCVKSSGFQEKGLFSKYRLLYLGPTNPRYLGAVYSKDGVIPRTELTKWVTPDQLKTFVAKGVDVPGCDVNIIKDQFISLALGKLPFTTTDSALKFTFSNQDTIINTFGTWTIDGINTTEFLNFLNDNQSDKNIAHYREAMLDKRNVVSFQVVKLTGFSADIKTKKSLDIGLDLSIPVLSAQSSSGKDSIICAFHFKKTNNTTVHVESSGQFYAFALVMKGKEF